MSQGGAGPSLSQRDRRGLVSNILQRQWHPLQLAAGVTVRTIDEKGNPVMRPKYSGLYALRHFFCSWRAARRQDGGLGLPLKARTYGRVKVIDVGRVTNDPGYRFTSHSPYNLQYGRPDSSAG